MEPRPRPRAASPRPRPQANGTAPAAENAIVPDDQRRVIEALEELRSAARHANLPPLRVDWIGERSESGTEADPELRAAFERALRRINDIEAIGTGPQPASLAELAEPPNADDWLIEGFIRPGTTVMITGLPGAAKSWAARQLALSAGSGKHSFLDHYPIVRRMNVLVIDEDNGERDEWRRDAKLLSFLSLQRSDMGRVYRISLADVRLDEEHWQIWLRGLIGWLELDLVILDPVSEMHGGKELRDDPSFRSMLRFLKKLKVDYPRTAVVLVHHNRKRPSNERDAPATLDDVRGQWGQTPDVVAIMRALAEKRFRWELFKRVPHSAIVLQQEDGTGGLSFVADETTSTTRANSNDGQVLNAIDAAGEATAEEIRIATGLSRSGVNKVLKRLHMAGLISKGPRYQREEDAEERAARLLHKEEDIPA